MGRGGMVAQKCRGMERSTCQKYQLQAGIKPTALYQHLSGVDSQRVSWDLALIKLGLLLHLTLVNDLKDMIG